MKKLILILILVILTGCTNTMIKEGDKIQVNYVGTFNDGTVFDSSEGKAPLEFTAGAHQVIKGFEDAVIGMKIGEEKQIKLSPEQAYGNSNPDLIQKIPRDKIPEEAKIGDILTAATVQGQSQAKITELTDTEATLDLNHPMAGKTLNFKITIVKIF